jgi:hypothetical protein
MPTGPAPALERTDQALLLAYLLAAILGSWLGCLLVIDGVIYLAAAWLGDAWDLFFGQNTGRAVSTLFQFGPAWALRPLFDGSPAAFVVAAHALYFAGPLLLWLIVRMVELQRIYSRLYLAIAASLIFFTSEMVCGIGLWLIWLAWLADPSHTRLSTTIVTLLLAPAMALSHPGVAALSLSFAAVGGLLIAFGRPFPRRLAIGSAAMGVALAAAYFALAAAFPPTNPTIAAQHAGAKYDYIDPVWMLATLAFFPMLAVLWLLLIAPGLEGAALRWRLPRLALLMLAAIGVWFAFNGTNLLTWIFARQTAPYALALALALALASPAATWLEAARLPFALFAGLLAVASISYAIDLLLFGRAMDQRLATLSAATSGAPRLAELPTPPTAAERSTRRIYLKWAAAPDYVRDIVLPDYGADRMSSAFYTFFHSGRRAVLYRPLDRPGEWVPFECAPVERALATARDEVDRRFLRFLDEKYCVRAR